MAREPGSRGKLYRDEPTSNPRGPQHVDPHSKWQILIETTRAKKKIPMRELAAKAQIHSSTLFNWLRSKKGFPSRLYYTQELNKRLAAALGVKAADLVNAYNESASVPPYEKSEVNYKSAPPSPAPSVSENTVAYKVDGLRRFLAMLKATGNKNFTLDQLEQMARIITDM